MKKFKKNLSKKIFSSFFVFQFIITTSFMPVVALANEEAKVEVEASKAFQSEESIKETKEETLKKQVVKEEIPQKEEDYYTIAIEDEKESSNEDIILESEEISIVDTSKEEVKVEEVNVTNLPTTGGFEDTKLPPSQDVQKLGSITFCKVIVNMSGQVVDGSEFAGESFSVKLFSPEVSGFQETVVFNAPFSNPSTFGADNEFTRECKTVNGLILADYKYSEEITSGPTLWNVTYTEVDINNPLDKFQSWAYRSLEGDIFSDGSLDVGSVSVGLTPTVYLINIESDKKPPSGSKYGSITVCKAITSEGLTLTTEEQHELLSGFDFNVEFLAKPAHLDASFNEASIPANVNFQTPLNTQIDIFWDLPMECETRIDLPLGNYFYNEESITPTQNSSITWLAPKYNDFNTTGDYFNNFAYSNELFTEDLADDGNRNTNADGHIVLTSDVPDRILLVENTFKKDNGGGGGDRTGSITVCKAIAKKVGDTITIVTDTSEIAGYEFTIPWVNEPQALINNPGGHVYDTQPTLSPDAQFTANTFTPTRNYFGGVGFDSDCETYSNLPLGGYFYGEEIISGGDGSVTWLEPKYNDQATIQVEGIDDMFLYDDTKFTLGNPNGGVGVDPNADGHIGLNKSNEGRNRTLVVLNIFEVKDEGGGGNNNPTITVPGEACLLNNVTEFDLLAGASANDTEDGNLTSSIVVTGSVTFGTNGSYVITYSITDSKGAVVTATRTINVRDDCDPGTGGGGDTNTVNVPENSCVVRGTDNFDFLSEVSASNSLTGEITLTEGGNVVITESVNFNENGEYTVTYIFALTNNVTDTITKTRTIEIKSRCSGGGGGGGGGSSSGSGGGGGNNGGEILGASSCIQFTTYNRLGNSGGEIMALQVFLNEYMNAGLTVDGVYGRATTQAVHDFQAYHWSEIIDPWTPPLSANTTGWEYKTTRATINAIIKCPEAPVFLEDPATIFSITEVTNGKEFTDAQILEVTQLLALAQILGVEDGSNANFTTVNSIANTSTNIIYEK